MSDRIASQEEYCRAGKGEGKGNQNDQVIGIILLRQKVTTLEIFGLEKERIKGMC